MSEKPHIREAIIVEGRYDKNTVLQAVDALVVETGGFSILNDREKVVFLRRLAETRGVVILTDGDGAGFVIRGKLKSLLPREGVRHAYIPDLYGKEKRKAHPSAEGKLGVEGMLPSVIIEALRRAGCTFSEEESAAAESSLSPASFISLGLSGGQNSAALRAALQKELGFPEKMSGKALCQALRYLYTYAELEALIARLRPVCE